MKRSEIAAHLDALEEKRREILQLRAKDAQKVDVFARLGYVPTPRQLEFHQATEDEVFYGGAMGGGKSKAIVMDAVRLCHHYPEIEVWAFRNTYPEAEASYIKELRRINFAQSLGAIWRPGDKDLWFPNGSVWHIRYALTENDAAKYLSAEMQALYLDESTRTRPAVIEMLKSRLRSSQPHVPVIGLRAGSNPGGVSHGLFRNRYVVPTEDGAKILTDDEGLTLRYIRARATDNPHLDEKYMRRLNSMDPVRRAAYRDGNWDSFEGQFFSEWNRERFVIPDGAVEIPASWRRLAGVDYGYAAPWAVIFGAIDEDGRIWIYRELYDRKVGEAEQAERILKITAGEKIERYLADPAMWAKAGDAPSIESTYRKAGVPLTKAENDRVIGWAKMRSVMEDKPACKYHRDKGLERCPGLHLFSSVKNLAREITDAPYDTSKTEDLDTNASDHALDACRYLIMRAAKRQKKLLVSGE